MATCSKCDSTRDLYVHYIPDPYNDYPLDPEVICSRCPPPTNVWKDGKDKYLPRIHDKLLGLSDYVVGLSFTFRGSRPIRGLCFECNQELDLSKGYGHRYVPDEYWISNEQTSVAYCEPCYTEICKAHREFDQPLELAKLKEKINAYRERTINGWLREDYVK